MKNEWVTVTAVTNRWQLTIGRNAFTTANLGKGLSTSFYLSVPFQVLCLCPNCAYVLLGLLGVFMSWDATWTFTLSSNRFGPESIPWKPGKCFICVGKQLVSKRRILRHTHIPYHTSLGSIIFSYLSLWKSTVYNTSGVDNTYHPWCRATFSFWMTHLKCQRVPSFWWPQAILYLIPKSRLSK